MALNKMIFKRAEDVFRDRFLGAKPMCGLVLGSGLSGAADIFNVKDAIEYRDIPGLGRATVAGHGGGLLWADHGGLELFVFRGRRHWYEGAGWEPVALPVYLLKTFGARVLVVTNMAAGLRDDLKPGMLMVVDDHINMIQPHPLSGEYDPFWGPRFPDQSSVYDPELRAAADKAAERDGKNLSHGVYMAVPGPAYETPAEIRAYKTIGADSVGMSTAPEAALAHAAGLRVFGVSCIANKGAGIAAGPLSHEEVINAAARAEPDLVWLLKIILDFLSESAMKAKKI